MFKYVAIIDYKAGKGMFNQIPLEAKTVVDAMAEANRYFNDDVYLIDIMEKEGKTEKIEGGKATKYCYLIRNRGDGWQLNNSIGYWIYLQGKGWTDWDCKFK